MNTLEDDIRAVLHSQADAMQVPEPRLARSLTLIRLTPQQHPRRRWMLAAAAVLLVVVAAVVFVQRGSHKPAVVTTTTPPTTPPDTTTPDVASTTIANGWLAFAEEESGLGDVDIYLVREGSPARRIAGSDVDATDQVCPAFSPDGTRLAYGQADVTDDGGVQNAGLVIADLTADGVVSATTTIALDADQRATADGMFRPPCPIWSADGRRLAFGAGTYQPHIHRASVDEVWVADTETDDIRQLPGLSMVTDFEWAADGTQLYIADGGAINVYSVATDETPSSPTAAGARATSPCHPTVRASPFKASAPMRHRSSCDARKPRPTSG